MEKMLKKFLITGTLVSTMYLTFSGTTLEKSKVENESVVVAVDTTSMGIAPMAIKDPGGTGG
jgi:hypothetical protein